MWSYANLVKIRFGAGAFAGERGRNFVGKTTRSYAAAESLGFV